MKNGYARILRIWENLFFPFFFLNDVTLWKEVPQYPLNSYCNYSLEIFTNLTVYSVIGLGWMGHCDVLGMFYLVAGLQLFCNFYTCFG